MPAVTMKGTWKDVEQMEINPEKKEILRVALVGILTNTNVVSRFLLPGTPTLPASWRLHHGWLWIYIPERSCGRKLTWRGWHAK